VNDPQRYRVIQFGLGDWALSIGEKPLVPESDYAATGLNFHDGGACDIAAGLRPGRAANAKSAILTRLICRCAMPDMDSGGCNY
jgi:glucose-1-phosphate thymidylyltransferase